MKHVINLDGLMTAPLEEEAFAAMLPFFREHAASPSAGHSGGIFVREAIERARREIAVFIGARDFTCMHFTSSATESANLAITGVARRTLGCSQKRHLIVGAIEHPSVLEAARALQAEGVEVTELATDSIGRYDVSELKRALRKDTFLVALAHSNHDLGTLQNIRELAQATHETSALFYCDAATSAGWSPLDVARLGVDLMSFSFHRMGGPIGIGALYLSSGVELDPLLRGGMQENGLRAGTLNTPAIVGAAKACELRLKKWDAIIEKTCRLQKMLHDLLDQKIEHIHLNGAPLDSTETQRLPHHLSLSFEGIEAEALMLRLDLQDVQLHAGAGCVARALKVPYTLRAIGLSDARALSTLLIGLGPHLTEELIEIAAEKIATSVQKLRMLSPQPRFA